MSDWNFTTGDQTPDDLDSLLGREWLAVNGLGGYASSSVPGMNTRKYHGLLVAAMSPPVRRMVLLSRVEESVVCDGWPAHLACNEYPGTIFPRGDQALQAFSPVPFPRWAYQGQGWTVEKTLRLLTGTNTVVLTYTLLGGDCCRAIELQVRPAFALRGIHDLMYQWNGQLDVRQITPGRLYIPATGRTPEVFFAHDGVFETDPRWYLNTIYRREQERGYAGLEDVWNPGVVRWSLAPGKPVHFICSTDPIDVGGVIESANRQFGPTVTDDSSDPVAMLTRAAGQFVLRLTPADRSSEVSVATNYPWSPPSTRFGLIGFTGLFLVPGRVAEARAFLLGLVDRLRDGLLPTSTPETGGPGVYNGVDPSLWFVNAVHAYLKYTGDTDTVRGPLLEAVLAIVKTYRHGTLLGIVAGPDGLLTTDQPGVATTWMDAQADGWVVTPRGGKAVEVNALWYNAIRIAADVTDQFGGPSKASELSHFADTVQASFNRRFWNPVEGCCYDVLEESGNDPSIRPNQLLAISLPYPVLSESRFEPVLEKVRKLLMTPFGPRTLAPTDRNYRGHYGGDVIQRDRAHHQGSVHPWLLGPFATAYLRVHGRGDGARAEVARYLEPCLAYMRDGGLGQLCELFDGDAPHRPGGAIASAPAVGELLRAYAEDVQDRRPKPRPAEPANDRAGAV